MINVRTIKKLKENDGLTLRNGKPITYRTGWQVATEGIETTDPDVAIKAVKAYGGNCGLWYQNNIFFIDKSKRISTKKEAVQIGKKYKQISILRWSDMSLFYL